MENIIKRFPRILLTKKKIVIISSIFLVIIIGTVLAVHFLKKGNSSPLGRAYDYVSPEGYAEDSKEYIDSNFLYQDFGKQEPKYKVYGETGYTKFGFVDSTRSPLRSEERITSIHVDCGESVVKPKTEGNTIIIEDIAEKSGEEIEYTTIPLGEQPVEVGNHCAVQFNSPYENMAAQEAGEIYYNLNSYLVLPDGSLITVTSLPDIIVDQPEIQVNIFENETRVVMMDGGAYFRIVKQPEGKIFSIQIYDRIFKTTGPAELFASTMNEAKLWDTAGNLSKEQVLHSEYYTSFDGGQKFLDLTKDEEGNGYLDTGAFRLIAGEGDIWIRGTNEKEKFESNKTYIVADSKEPTNLSGGSHISSAGYVEDEALSRYIPNTYTIFITNQIALNNSKIGLNVSNTDGKSTGNKVSAYVKHYKNTWKKYIENQIEEIVAQEEQKQAEEQAREEARRASNSLTITCPKGMYYIGGNSCCPNGYLYNSSMDKCTKTTYYSQNTKTPRYNPSNGSSPSNGSGTSSNSSCEGMSYDACFPMDISSGQCPNGVPIASNFFVKNGECCHKITMECVD